MATALKMINRLVHLNKYFSANFCDSFHGSTPINHLVKALGIAAIGCKMEGNLTLTSKQSLAITYVTNKGDVEVMMEMNLITKKMMKT